jgi:hypothetical protein
MANVICWCENLAEIMMMGGGYVRVVWGTYWRLCWWVGLRFEGACMESVDNGW